MRRAKARHSILAASLSALVAVLGSSRSEPLPPAPAQSMSRIAQATITGYVIDAATGRPVANAQVSTVPATETVVTNQQGLYVLNAGYAFGTATVTAGAGRYRQVRSTCVSVKAGLNTLGDVTLLHEDEDVEDECPTPCAEGEECRLGQCVPGCRPACECTEKCEAGQCMPNANVPGEDSCGRNATWLGGGLCQCKLGAVPSADGRTCVTGTEATSCPENAFATDVGCQCSQGFIPNRDGDRCVTPAEAAVPVPLGDGTIARSWELPFEMPRGLAVSGTDVWTVDLGKQALVRLQLNDDGTASVVYEVDLGTDAWRVMDLAATSDTVYLARRGLAESRSTTSPYRHPSTVMVVDIADGAVRHLEPNGAGDMVGLALKEDAILTLEYDQIQTRSLDDAQMIGVAMTRETSLPVGDAQKSYFILVPSGAGYASARPLGLSFTRNQLLTFVGITYDGESFVAHFDVMNGAGSTVASAIRALSILIPSSHVAGFDVAGASGWIAVGGSGLEKPIIGEVSFDGLL